MDEDSRHHRGPESGGVCVSALLTDLYQLTMAQAYWMNDMDTFDASFHMSFRENPFEGGFTVWCGLSTAIDYLESMRFSREDVGYLATLESADGTPLFTPRFLEWLRTFRFRGDVDAVPEGDVVFPRAPIMRVTGPIIDCQIVESALLNTLNFQSLIATKAARVRLAAGDDSVAEFGLRRAQGPDGGLSASRAAYIGGADSTSNVLAGRLLGIPVVGTHAHSWVMAFDSEAEAFERYAQVMPGNCTLLVDTYDTIEGVRRAVEVGRSLRQRGYELAGIRIDSGDLAWLSRKARAILDESGFTECRIVATNELDEHLIGSLKAQGACIDSWGVGTKLVTAHGQPALGGVYKLSAVRAPGDSWRPRLKVSDSIAKVTIPGRPGVRRFEAEGMPIGDMVYDIEHAPVLGDAVMFDPVDSTRRKVFSPATRWRELLLPMMRGGKRLGKADDIRVIRTRASESVSRLDATHTRFLNPHIYPVGLESSLAETRAHLVSEARAGAQGETWSRGGGDRP